MPFMLMAKGISSTNSATPEVLCSSPRANVRGWEQGNVKGEKDMLWHSALKK
ncbi:hypothetical protein MACH16_21630 [Marinomonas pontica]|uniref:Uncharacterized protein n=1 Tax=Marinomonas pontica TaxID=264739 RepID=A0ABM8FER7_9GAMM|nr:hypothetical protein MACH16_21630 [Marinomonas pontica]